MLSKHRAATKIFSLCQSAAAATTNDFAILKRTGIVHRYAGKHHHAPSIQRRGLSSIGGGEAVVLESDYGPVASPNLNLPQYLWKDVAKWGDKPMVVRSCDDVGTVVNMCVCLSELSRHSSFTLVQASYNAR